MARQKIYPAQELKGLVERLRQQGQRIVFTNGCFDLLHPGHLHTLYAAKEQGDILIVGLNADASVRKLKGEGRPIWGEQERAMMLAALEAVDFVTIFPETTPLNLIRLLQPDVLVKGGDWTLEAVVGREIVEERGGKVVLVPHQGGFSTTSLIARVWEQKEKALAPSWLLW